MAQSNSYSSRNYPQHNISNSAIGAGDVPHQQRNEPFFHGNTGQQQQIEVKQQDFHHLNQENFSSHSVNGISFHQGQKINSSASSSSFSAYANPTVPTHGSMQQGATSETDPLPYGQGKRQGVGLTSQYPPSSFHPPQRDFDQNKSNQFSLNYDNSTSSTPTSLHASSLTAQAYQQDYCAQNSLSGPPTSAWNSQASQRGDNFPKWQSSNHMSGTTTNQQPMYGDVGPPPLPGQQYHPPTHQAVLRPPPLPGQPYTPGLPPSNNINYSQNSLLPPPPLPGQQTSADMSKNHIQPTSAKYNFIPGGSSHMQQKPPSPQNINHFPPTPLSQPMQGQIQGVNNSLAGMNISDPKRPIDLLQETRILPVHKPVATPLRFESPADRGMLVPPNRKNCDPNVFCCTLKAIPQTQNLLQKVKLPLGLVIHPFKDLNSLPVISAGQIVRCKRCRTYVNPFVTFIDERRWRCNMCFAVNDVPEEFLYHPLNKTYGEPHTRPECTNSTMEFIAPQEYMLRPPQPAVYLFLMDVSHSAIESGYLQILCNSLLENLDRLPGDSRTQIGFLTYNQTVHFYRLNEGLTQPQMMIVSDIEDVFVPTPENLLVNLRESKNLVQELLHQLPSIHNLVDVGEVDTYSALGPALEVAKKLMSPIGGRVTVFQHSLPSSGPGKLESREDPNIRAGDVPTASLNPATDYYKKLALDCSASQVSVDFFFLNSHYVDIATLSCSSRFSAGDIHYYPGLHTVHNPNQADRLSKDLDRYLTRKIGFESVMRIRCTKGLNIHTFHGNFFVRSTDLLALANINPDAGFAVNLTIDDPLTDLSAVCFQAALLYTNSKGERRIRVHTMCIPVVKSSAEVLNAVDCAAVVSLLAKMAVDRSITATIGDARDALINAVIDPLNSFKETLPPGMTTGGVYVPPCLRLFPLYIHCLLKHPAFRIGLSTKLDDRVFAMINFKMQPIVYFLQDIHPDLYRVDDLTEEGCKQVSGRDVPQPNILPLSAESLCQSGTFLLDCGWYMYLFVGRSTSRDFIQQVLGFHQFSAIEDPMYCIPEFENSASELFQSFIESLQDNRPHHAMLRVIRDDSRERFLFLSHLHQDRFESTKSLQDFLLHIKQKLN